MIRKRIEISHLRIFHIPVFPTATLLSVDVHMNGIGITKSAL